MHWNAEFEYFHKLRGIHSATSTAEVLVPFTFLNCLYFSTFVMRSINIVQFCLPINLGDILGCMVHALSVDATELEYQPHPHLESQVKHSFMIKLGHHIEEWLFIPCQGFVPTQDSSRAKFCVLYKSPGIRHDTPNSTVYTTWVDIYSKTRYKKLVTHLESHMLRARWVLKNRKKPSIKVINSMNAVIC